MGEPSLTELKMAENARLEQLPMFPELELVARTFEWPAPSGKILSQDEERMVEVATLVLEGKSDRRIAQICGVNRKSIRPIMRILEARGKLEPLKERLVAGLGRLAELSVQRATELLEDDLMPAQSIPIVMGVAIDKRELLAGGVTARVEARETIDLAGSYEALKALVARAPRRAIEVGLTGERAIGATLAGVIEVDTAPDTAAVRPGGDPAAGSEGGGGGVRALAAGHGGDGLAPGNLSEKGSL